MMSELRRKTKFFLQQPCRAKQNDSLQRKKNELCKIRAIHATNDIHRKKNTAQKHTRKLTFKQWFSFMNITSKTPYASRSRDEPIFDKQLHLKHRHNHLVRMRLAIEQAG